jgi:hypothetical protein
MTERPHPSFPISKPPVSLRHLASFCKLQFHFKNQQFNPLKWVRFEQFAFASPYGK